MLDALKGYALTPREVVDEMVDKLFQKSQPEKGSTVIDPGCGTGVFIDGVLRWCDQHNARYPRLIGVDSDPRHIAYCRRRFADLRNVDIHAADFLDAQITNADYIVGNPPYVPISGLSPVEREAYRRRYATAKGRFDLYLLFFERALALLRPGGRLVFITPEKFLYVSSAAHLRDVLRRKSVVELQFLDEETFPGLVTYPLISTIENRHGPAETRVRMRDGRETVVSLPNTAESWLPSILGSSHEPRTRTLSDVCVRISCGVATGADSVFVIKNARLTDELSEFAYPTIAGRQLDSSRILHITHSMLVPYDRNARLLPEGELHGLRRYLRQETQYRKLLARTCVSHKPWYAFHETPPLRDILRPKLLCKDITSSPYFVKDESGSVVPRHSVYYVVPRDPGILDELADYLNSEVVHQWLRDHCQRAAKGYLRIQSHVLKRVPIPETFFTALENDLFAASSSDSLTA